MSLRMPQDLSNSPRFETGHSALEHELLAEKAANLGRLGQDVERALRNLTAAESADAREAHLLNAAGAVWRLFVQRECCGMLEHDQAILDYAIPPVVLARIGAL